MTCSAMKTLSLAHLIGAKTLFIANCLFATLKGCLYTQEAGSRHGAGAYSVTQSGFRAARKKGDTNASWSLQSLEPQVILAHI